MRGGLAACPNSRGCSSSATARDRNAARPGSGTCGLEELPSASAGSIGASVNHGCGEGRSVAEEKQQGFVGQRGQGAFPLALASAARAFHATCQQHVRPPTRASDQALLLSSCQPHAFAVC